MGPSTTTSRVLRVLSLLQSRRYWPGSELADRVGVSPRTVRRDIDRLRDLGYQVSAERGSAGGYLLDAGSSLPPLLFTSEEAIALTVSLRSAAVTSSVRGMPDLAVTVLAKVEQVLPSALRGRVRAMQSAVAPEFPNPSVALVDPETLAVFALACRDSQIVRFEYTSADGSATSRRVEPAALVPVGRRWYLVAWDLARDDWRTFRIDRVTTVVQTHVHVSPRPGPSPDVATFVSQQLGRRAEPAFVATVRMAAPLAVAEAHLAAFTTGLVADGPFHTLWTIRDDRIELLVSALTWIPWAFTIVDGDELREFLRGFVERSGG